MHRNERHTQSAIRIFHFDFRGEKLQTRIKYTPDTGHKALLTCYGSSPTRERGPLIFV